MDKMTPPKHKTPNYRLKVVETVPLRPGQKPEIISARWTPVPLRASRKDLDVVST